MKDEGPNVPFYMYLSGSKGEGFRFFSSDEDIMFIYNNVRVIQSMSQCRLYDVNTTLLMMETEQTRPGFVLLRLIGDTHNRDIRRSCLQYPPGTYVSSQKWRDDEFPLRRLSETMHGPCVSGVIGTVEYDLAHCLKSDIFPKAASSSIRRLQEKGWPSPQVLQDIVTEGCHFVAISAKVPNFELLEWRVSFSAAETKLVHNMNHTQFLCYGLLKIFLKEAVNANNDLDGLLCSYYLKTAVFWEIMDATQEWTPSTFLECFWRCFKRLIQWVNEEYCPNFFIPENNMMMGKFTGRTKAALLLHLATLYKEGYRCLLRCPSLYVSLSNIIRMPIMVPALPSDEDFGTKIDTDIETIVEVRHPVLYDEIMNTLWDLECLNQLKEIYTSDLQRLLLYVWKSNLLCQLYLLFICHRTERMDNKHLSILYTVLLNSMRHHCIDHVNSLSAIAVGNYKQGSYKDVIKAANKIRTKLQNPHIMYRWALDEDKYRAAGGENTPLIKMMVNVVTHVVALVINTRLPELLLEHQETVRQEGTDVVTFPPLILANFLLFLSNWHMGYDDETEQVLCDLFGAVHFDNGHHIHETDRAISWEILGICQEMMGDYQGAYQSYTTALQQPFTPFKCATLTRLLIILYKLMCSS